MKFTTGKLGLHFGWGLLRNAVLASLAVGIALVLTLTPGSAEAGGQDELIAPIVLEEGRIAPVLIEPPSVPEPPERKVVEPTSVPPPQVREVIEPPSILEENQGAPKDVQGDGGASITQQTSTTLISNSGKNFGGYVEKAGENAQSFTTGSNSGGYKLTGVRVRVQPHIAPVPSNYSVSIRTNSRSGEPGITLGTLTKSGSLSPLNAWTLVEFPVSGDGIDLVANTRYWLVSSANNSVRIAITHDDGEDTGGAAGWSIGNEDALEFKNSNWVDNTTGTLQFEVIGYAIDRDSQPPRDPIKVTYTNPQSTPVTVENRAASADSDTLWDYFYDSCSAQRSLTGLVHDYSQFTEINGRTVRTQASNGWKWVWIQNAQGDVTGTRPQTVTECASHGMYLRRANCANADWLARNPHLHEGTCPTYRTW